MKLILLLVGSSLLVLAQQPNINFPQGINNDNLNIFPSSIQSILKEQLDAARTRDTTPTQINIEELNNQLKNLPTQTADENVKQLDPKETEVKVPTAEDIANFQAQLEKKQSLTNSDSKANPSDKTSSSATKAPQSSKGTEDNDKPKVTSPTLQVTDGPMLLSNAFLATPHFKYLLTLALISIFTF